MPNNQRIRQILAIVATAGVIFINYLAAKGRIGGVTPAYISDKYPTLMTPAGYAFSIWSLIYLGLIAFAVFQALPANAARFAKIRTIYILSCAANCAWIYLWHYEHIAASLVAMFVLLGSLVLINADLLKIESTGETRISRAIFGVYFGWITAAAIVNFTIFLISASVKMSDSSVTVVACVLLIAATLLGVIVRSRFNNAAYPVAVAWALTAIAVKQSEQTAIIVVSALCVVVLLVSALSGVLKPTKQSQ